VLWPKLLYFRESSNLSKVSCLLGPATNTTSRIETLYTRSIACDTRPTAHSSHNRQHCGLLFHFHHVVYNPRNLFSDDLVRVSSWAIALPVCLTLIPNWASTLPCCLASSPRSSPVNPIGNISVRQRYCRKGPDPESYYSYLPVMSNL
jgi:hypothetical protein